jgi:hypothetical protein
LERFSIDCHTRTVQVLEYSTSPRVPAPWRLPDDLLFHEPKQAVQSTRSIENHRSVRIAPRRRTMPKGASVVPACYTSTACREHLRAEAKGGRPFGRLSSESVTACFGNFPPGRGCHLQVDRSGEAESVVSVTSLVYVLVPSYALLPYKELTRTVLGSLLPIRQARRSHGHSLCCSSKLCGPRSSV